MFILLLNLPIMDIIGATAFLPQLVHSIVSKNRSISYPGCFLQALLVHIYGTGNLMFLTAMAYDRYIAICMPLRYNSIMTSNILMKIVVAIWLCTISLMVVLLGLFARFNICMNRIVDVYCNNPSLVKLVCEDSTINNYYGLFTIVLIQGGSLFIVVYTYIQILVTCVISKQPDAKGKALQTCGTHLIVFLFLELNTAIALISHRFESVSPYLRRALGVSVMYYNTTHFLTLQSLNLPMETAISTFLLATLSYMVILFCNLVLILTIVLNKTLHQPMYLLLINLPINDLLGSTAFFPHVIKELLLDTRRMNYAACVAQAFCVHTYGVGAVLILSVMAYDRYVAICRPLVYGSVMTNAHVMRLITAMWLLNLALVGVLFALLLRLPRCRSLMAHSYCDNPSLLGLVCADTSVNNAYGLLMLAVVQAISHAVILYTYLRILVACFRTRRQDTRSKAYADCLGLFTIISYRLRDVSPFLRRFIGASAIIFPPTLNPIIYGLRTKEIRGKALAFFRGKLF
ncbi:Olfactory receptor 52E4 [Merluccius polli]|uniref:Olfactory receptor 52E4 n=1 Tax=Merluccius polli TaxID=89951 RepID=A0AA47NZU1_MERPO|nr:Olfactory receptor 52E4 [Merluccius polli]